jgi:biotin carboxyl carrier protein
MKLRITVEGKSYEVEVEVLEDAPVGSILRSATVPTATMVPPVTPATSAPRPDIAAGPVAAVETTGSVVNAPIVGTIMHLKVTVGDIVAVNQVLLVMEAMKMETNIASPVAGKVKAIYVSPGEAVKAGQLLVEIE